MKIKNKKAVIMTLETVIFLVLNLIFLIMMIMFAYQQGNRYFVYEESYAKQVVLLIDNAKPETAMLLDISELIEIAKENKKDVNEIIKLDKINNKVFVSLRGERGYSYKYFTEADVNFKIDENNLAISVEKK